MVGFLSPIILVVVVIGYFYLKEFNPKAIDSIRSGIGTTIGTTFGCLFKLVFGIIGIYLAWLFFSWIGATGIIILLLILILFK